MNNNDAGMISNMPGSQLTADTSTITFRYDPLAFKAGLFLTIMGIALLVIVFFRRKSIEQYLASLNQKPPVVKKAGKMRKSS